ncbi:MAG: pitrilysin family protein [Vicinamibacteria bacterium]
MKTLCLAVTLAASAPLASAQPIPAKPDQLKFAPVSYTPPKAADHRVVLKNGMVVYVVEDPTLPLVNIALTIRTGSYLEPAGKEGLASFTGAQIRQGGTKSLTAEQLDEKLDFLAATVATGIVGTAGSAGLNCLSDNLDQSLAVFVEMLRHPRFQEDRLALAKEQALQEMKKRNDDSADIERYEWGALFAGEKHYSNHWATEASIRAITRDDLVAFHRAYFQPANMVAAVSGSFKRADIVRKLEAAFGGWPSNRTAVPPVPGELYTAAPGLYRMNKDVNQGRVTIGLPMVKRDHPDIYALEVMNEILGGSGFTSRITKTVRSNEGLAYSAGSALSFGVYSPGPFRAVFQSKSRTVAYAAQLVFGEIEKLRTTPVTEDELKTIKDNLIATFPGQFASKAQTAGVFAADEYTKRDPAFWQTYRDRIAAVTAADVQRVAREHLVPGKMLVLVVGDQKEIAIGDGKHDARLEALVSGKATDLTLRDPLTMKR